jgi:hypothetical protein
MPSTMGVDLISAGHRAIDTIDSVSDLQNVLRILNHKQPLINFANKLSECDAAMKQVTKYMSDNTQFEADILRPPATNTPGTDPRVTVDPGINLDGPTYRFSPEFKSTDSTLLSKFWKPKTLTAMVPCDVMLLGLINSYRDFI